MGSARSNDGDIWWKNPKWISAIAALFLSVGFCAFTIITVNTNQTVADQAPVIERLESLAEANRETLVQVSNNQAGIDSLVAFVEEVRNRDNNEGAVQVILEILCASSDPVRIEACQRLLQPEGDPP